jgi:hypothetical protein
MKRLVALLALLVAFDALPQTTVTKPTTITINASSGGAPTNVQVFQGGSSCTNNFESPGCVKNTQKLTWSAVAGATSYTILRNGSTYATGVACCTYTDTSATNSNQVTSYGVETAYAYQVEAVNGSGTSAGTYASSYLFSGQAKNSCLNFSAPGFGSYQGTAVQITTTSGSQVITVTSASDKVYPYEGFIDVKGAIPTSAPTGGLGQPYIYPYGSNGTSGTGGTGTYYISAAASSNQTRDGIWSTIEACPVTNVTESGHTYSMSIYEGGATAYVQQFTAWPESPPFDLNVGGMNNFVIDMYLTSGTQTYAFAIHSRPGGNGANTGDIYSTRYVTLVNHLASSYGTPVLNQWFTLTVPLNTLGIGTGVWNGYVVSKWHGTGQLSGSTFTIQATTDGSSTNIVAGDYMTALATGNGIGCMKVVSVSGSAVTVTACPGVGLPSGVGSGAPAYDAQAHVNSIVSGAGPDNAAILQGHGEPDATYFTGQAPGFGTPNPTGVGQWGLYNGKGSTIVSACSSGSPCNDWGSNRTSLYKPEIFLTGPSLTFIDNYGFTH